VRRSRQEAARSPLVVGGADRSFLHRFSPLRPLVTHHFALDDIDAAFDLFSRQRDGVLKVALHPGLPSGLHSFGLSVTFAPKRRATASRSGIVSTPMMSDAPFSLAPTVAHKPIGPCANTATLSPTRMPPRSATLPAPTPRVVP
jgi:hypothetical protein